MCLSDRRNAPIDQREMALALVVPVEEEAASMPFGDSLAMRSHLG